MPRAVAVPLFCLLHLLFMKNEFAEIYVSSFHRTEVLLLFCLHFVCRKKVSRSQGLKSVLFVVHVCCVFLVLLFVFNPLQEILVMDAL